MSAKQAITQIQAIVIAAILVVAVGAAYYYFTLPTPPPEEVTLTAWSWNSEDINYTFSETTFDEDHPWITLDSVELGGTGDTYSRLATSAAAGSGAPDIALIEGDRLPQFIKMGILLPLDDFGAGDYADEFWEPWWNLGVSEGQVYALPWDMGPCGLFYRADIFEKYDLKVPQTWDEFIEQGLKLKAQNDTIKFTSLSVNDRGTFQILIQQLGGQVFERVNGDVRCVASSEAIQAMELANSMAELGIAEWENWWADEWYSKQADGLIACIPIAQWHGGFLKEWLAPGNVGLWRAAPLPQFVAGETRSAHWGGSFFAITTQSEHPEEAWEFVEFMTCTVEGQLALYTSSGYYPALKAMQMHDEVAYEDPYYGGQNWVAVFSEESVPYLPDFDFTEYYQLMLAHLTAAQGRINEGTPVEEALEEMATITNEEIAAAGG
ncbi:MAG: ABC transporter substrate-binding protein [Candidatus Bathyarchaeia archaeon]